MSVLMVPELDGERWPTLGPWVVQFMEEYLVFGPGDIQGEPYRVDDETRALIYRMYEVYPKGHAMEGRRRFKHCALSMPKGTAKTEKAAAIAAVELHPEGPVRTVRWGWRGDPTAPLGGPVTDPYIPMIAYTEEQTEDLAYGALYAMISEGPLANDFDIGLARIMRLDGHGKAEARASAPDSADGARTTFQHIDESHRFVLPRQKAAVQTMKRNIPKRKAADAWTLETTTAFAAGEGSVAEGTMDYARQVAEGKVRDPRLFYFHRQAPEEFQIESVDLATKKGLAALRAAIVESRGPSAEWADIESIMAEFQDPQADLEYVVRVWLNQIRKGGGKAFDAERWKELARPDYKVEDGAAISIGFDGSRSEDSTGIVATELSTGYQWVAHLQEKPLRGAGDWEVDEEAVDAAMTDLFETYEVTRLYADPYWWEGWVSAWMGRWGDKKVWRWPTNRRRAMAEALLSYSNAIGAGEVSHSGDGVFRQHLGNAVRKHTGLMDADGKSLWVITKERADSPFKIDLAMSAALSWEARRDAIASGAGQEQEINFYV